MFRKMLLLCVAAPTVALVAVALFPSCNPGPGPNEYVCGINFSALGSANADTTLLSRPMTFMLTTSAKSMCAAPQVQNPFISACYAGKSCYTWQNSLVESSFKLSFDRTIVIEGDTVAAGTNILQQGTFARYASFKRASGHCFAQDYTLKISDTLLQKMVFHTGAYKARFECATTNSKGYDAQLYVVFR